MNIETHAKNSINIDLIDINDVFILENEFTSKERYSGNYINDENSPFSRFIFHYTAIFRSFNIGSLLVFNNSAFDPRDVRTIDIEKITRELFKNLTTEVCHALTNPNNVVIIQNSPVTMGKEYYIKVFNNTKFEPHELNKMCVDFKDFKLIE